MLSYGRKCLFWRISWPERQVACVEATMIVAYVLLYPRAEYLNS